MSRILDIDNLSVHFTLKSKFLRPKIILRAVESVSLHIEDGETLALVGESGSGKSTLGYVVAGLIKPTSGTISFKNKASAREADTASQIIFQDPFSALDPRMVVGEIVAEPLRLRGIRYKERRARAAELLSQVGLSADSINRYPHEFSGGQRQRIAIARALISDPELIVADEPLSALDVSIQSQILNLMADIKESRSLGFLFISHDLAVVHHIADRIAVLYLGRIMEVASRSSLFETPSHPYTQALLASVPRIGQGRRKPGKTLKGEIPTPLAPPPGCVFHTRCPRVQDICRVETPQLLQAPGRSDQWSACHFKD